MKPFSRLISVAVLAVAVLAACAHPKPASPQDNLVVGKTDGGAPLDQAVAQAAPQGEDEAAIPIVSNDATRGSRLALVTLVLFSDFQCPFCARVEPTLARLYETYGAEQLRLVFKNQPLPFHPQAHLAAEVGQGVLELNGNEAFWRYHDAAFQNQKDISPDAILRWAMAAGADEHAIKDGIDQKRWAPKVDRDSKTATAHGANGTPSAFINGISLVGAQPFDKFREIVEAELMTTKQLVAQGIPRDQIYTRRAAENAKSNEDRLAKEREKEEADDRAEAAKMAAAAKIVHKVPVNGAPMRGPATAEVTIVEFSDFQCPFCKRVEPTLDRIRKEYGDRVRIVWRDMPLSFHPRAEPAAELARFARATKGDAGFWSMHDAIYASQPALEDADLEKIATSEKLDVTKAMAAIKNKTYAPGLLVDQKVADDFEAAGTPNFFINGRHLVGAQPFETFKPIIDEEMARADELLKKGTAKTALYDALIKDGQGPAEPEKKACAPIPANAPFRGAANAKVVIQEFADFQCPFCGRVEVTVEELLKAYPGKIKVVWRDKPLSFHPDAPLAAEAAREAQKQKGNEGFVKMADLLFKNQGSLKRADLDGYAQTIGLDMTKFATALDTRSNKPAVDAEAANADASGVSGTPAFWVGPYYISGAQPLDKFRRLVDLALALPADKLTPAKPAAAAAAAAAARPNPALIVNDTVVGTGAAVKSGDKVRVQYVGRLADGSEFDNSRSRGGSGFSFKVGQGMVIKGWDQGLVGMKVGGKRRLTIPPELGYGDRGAGSKIPPKSTLVFDIELEAIE